LLPAGLVFSDSYSRFAAYFIDSVLLSVLVSIPPTLLGLYDYASTYPPEPMSRATFVGTAIFGAAVQAAYFLWFWTGGRRATPGQRVFGLQVGNAFDGQPLTMTQAILRWFAMGWWLSLVLTLPFLGLAAVAYGANLVWWVILGLSVIVSRTKQGFHDRIAGSAVVRPAGPTSGWAIGCVWANVLLTILSIGGVLLLINFLSSFEGVYPPGMNPAEVLGDYFTAQIRELWPN
jgi:uncharacterized RDD family membrane protein YckC